MTPTQLSALLVELLSVPTETDESRLFDGYLTFQAFGGRLGKCAVCKSRGSSGVQLAERSALI